jgi:hypothetical protein
MHAIMALASKDPRREETFKTSSKIGTSSVVLAAFTDDTTKALVTGDFKRFREAGGRQSTIWCASWSRGASGFFYP